MNTNIARILDMLERVIRFLVEYPIAPELPRAIAVRAEIVHLIDALWKGAQSQISGTSERAGAVKVRERLVLELRSLLCDVNRTARVLAAEHPGIRAKFRLPRTRSFPKLIVAAEAIIAAAAEIESSFLAAGMPATFLDDIRAMVAAFRSATSQKHDGSRQRAGSTAGLKAKASAGVVAATTLDAIVRNHFRGNAAVIAAWKCARHIERGPVRRVAPSQGHDTMQAAGFPRVETVSGEGNVPALDEWRQSSAAMGEDNDYRTAESNRLKSGAESEPSAPIGMVHFVSSRQNGAKGRLGKMT